MVGLAAGRVCAADGRGLRTRADAPLAAVFREASLSEIAAREIDRYKTAKVREREQSLVDRPLSNRTINKTLTRLGQILDVAVRYDLLRHNPVKAKVSKLKEQEPKRARLTGEQVQLLLASAGRNRRLLATAIRRQRAA